jgi:outer membrane immunogenic protein
MIKKIVACCFVVGALITAQCAAAADLSVAPLYKAPPAQYNTPVYNWTGFYLGVNGGGGWGHSWWQGPATGVGLSGGQVGGTAGYNWQYGNAVLGLEGDLDWSNLSGTSNSALCPGCGTSDSWLSTVRGRVGYAFDRFLVYGTGGAAFGDVRANFSSDPVSDVTKTGWAGGAGVEIAFAPHWTAKAEYLFVDLPNGSCTTNCAIQNPNGPPLIPNIAVKFNESIVRAGVNYRFGS